MKNPFIFLKKQDASDEAADTRNTTGEITVRRSKTMDWIARIGVVLVAFALWFYVMATDSPTTQWEYKGISVTVDNRSGLSVLTGDGVTVDVTVLGRRSQTINVTAADIDAHITVPEGMAAGKYSFDLEFNLPNGLTLGAASQTRVTLYLDNTTSIVVPVRARIDDYMLEDDYELAESEIVCSPSSVRITGPESVLQTVEYAQVALNLGKVERTVNCSGSMVPVDSSGNPVQSSYLTMQTQSATVTVPVYKYRTLPLQVRYRYGYFNDTNAEVRLEPSSVRIKGEADAVDAAEWFPEPAGRSDLRRRDRCRFHHGQDDRAAKQNACHPQLYDRKPGRHGVRDPDGGDQHKGPGTGVPDPVFDLGGRGSGGKPFGAEKNGRDNASAGGVPVCGAVWLLGV